MVILLHTDVLRWARQRAGLSIAALAEKLKADPEKIRAWEESGRITMSQAERLAHAAHVPLGYLYFRTPPKEELPIQDFRTLRGTSVELPSPELLDTLYDAQRKQEWYRAYLLTEGAEPAAFVASLSVSDNPLKAAEQVRFAMAISSAIAIKGATVREVLRRQVERLESYGVLVMRNGIVGNNTRRPLNVDEFRGFALSDQYAPLIFINGKDSLSAQIFTLMHELVHLWLGVSGVSNPLQSTIPSAGIERFCNAVAAELLVPEAEFRKRWKEVGTMDDPFGILVNDFKVSSLVILRRAHELGIISETALKTLYREAEAAFREMDVAKSKGGDFYATQLARHGRPLVRALVASTLEGKTPYREARSLLGVHKAKTFKDLANKVVNGN